MAILHKTLKDRMDEAFALFEVMKKPVLKEDEIGDLSEKMLYVLDKIKNDDYIINDYVSFSKELKESKRYFFLTQHSPEEFKELGITTYQVKGFPIGFALNDEGNGDVDITGVHNNSEIGGIGDELVQSAIRLGGNKLDHYDGFLGNLYGRNGFTEKNRDKWDDIYTPEGWDFETYGRPDVVYRRYTNNTVHLTESQFKGYVKFLRDREVKKL